MNNVKNIVLILMGVALIGCASSPKPVMEVQSEPPKTSKSVAFTSSHINSIGVIATDDKAATLYQFLPDKEASIRLSIEDYFIEQIIAKGFLVTSRSELLPILKEIDFQRTGLTDQARARLGQIRGVSALLVIRVMSHHTPGPSFSDQTGQFAVNLGAKLLDVSSGDILWVGNHRITRPVKLPSYWSMEQTLPSVVEAVYIAAARELAETFPLKRG